MGQKFEFSANNDGTHNVLCGDCKAVVSENVPCTFVDGKCQQCGAKEPGCNHTNQKFVANNNGTHDVLCGDCGETVSENVPCTYVNGKCQQCGGLYDVASNIPFPISIGKGLLRSLRSFFMSLFIR